ncbi:undecaprenyldiphospho-muramoylpentapeptide beta-N-acetylglucosaminyltransferase [Beduini massiliensis]|uniref:undecaprenyldiphospho-muramoylpentapeptide beta-N-acetylglucosaminyltransferase n=1 Tax=Beduini massiliensis TaxID=1585974 RepID=UPI00059AA311|nr:undecaprenyldiphospho-muramoylpentapeptide beta-N-acetylglucosaminyltransferase [Beduini massiliensis]
MKIIFATGGTGGHLYPAIALAKYIESHYDSTEFLFVGTTNRLESKVIPEMGYAYRGVHVLGLAGSPLQKAKALGVFAASLRVTRKIVKEFKPDLVIGFGGYVSASIVMSASSLGIKTMIHEQNSLIGLANKILIKRVDKIICCYDKAYENFPKEKTLLLGNPRATEVVESKKDLDIKKKYHLDPNKKTVLIVMGSLGSATVNDILKDTVEKFKDKTYQIILVTGKNGYDKMIQEVQQVPHNVSIVPYINDMPSLLSACDLVVSRAGASTIAELTALGSAMILIPSPYVASNHQEYNAMELVNKQAARMIKENELTSERLIEEIDQLFNDSFTLITMKENAKKLGKVNACADISKVMMELIGK